MTPRERYACIVCKSSISMGVSPRIVMGRSRERSVANVRHAIMHRLHNYGLSACEIGRIMDRDHTTVLHGIQRVSGLIPIFSTNARFTSKSNGGI